MPQTKPGGAFAVMDPDTAHRIRSMGGKAKAAKALAAKKPDRYAAARAARAAKRAAGYIEPHRVVNLVPAVVEVLTPAQILCRAERARKAERDARKIAEAKVIFDAMLAAQRETTKGGRPRKATGPRLNLRRDPADALVEALGERWTG